MTDERIDFPFEEIAKEASVLVEQGAVVFFKFTCGKCGVRQTFDVPNVLYTSGSCQECGHVTDLRHSGGNFLVVAGNPEKIATVVQKIWDDE